MAGEAEIEQHRALVGQDHVLGLEIEMDHVLPVQVGQRRRDRDADALDLGEGQGRLLDRFRQACPGNEAHGDEGDAGKIARRDEARHMRARQALVDQHLGLVADDGRDVGAGVEHRNLHDERSGMIRMAGVPEACHPAGLQPLAQGEAIDDRAGVRPFHLAPYLPICRRRPSQSGKPAALIFRTVFCVS